MGKPEENTHLDDTEDPDKQDEVDKPQDEESKNAALKEKLGPRNKARLDNKEVTPDQLLAESERVRTQAKTEMRDLQQQNPKIFSYKENNDLLDKLENTQDPDLMKEILEQIQKKPEEYEKNANDEKNKEKELGMDHEKIKEKIKIVENKLKDPKVLKWLGTKQPSEFLGWYKNELSNKPSIANAEQMIHDLENHSTKGIPPRKDFYIKTLEPQLKKYGLTLEDTPFYKAEGLSERKEGMKNAKKVEEQMERMKQVGLYSHKAIKETMTALLKATSLPQQKEIANSAIKVTEKEAEQFTSENSSVFDETMTVHGETSKKMSEKSKKLYLDFYKDSKLQDRESMVLNWKKLVENEANLTKELGEVYKDDKEGYKAAIKNFSLLDFKQKEEAIVEHKDLVKNETKETVAKSQEITHKALTAIEEAKKNKFISNDTARKYKKLFYKTDNFKDPNTGKLDLEKMEKGLDLLTSKQAETSKENRNLQAYEIERQNYQVILKKFEKDNPDLSKEEVKKWGEKYDEESWKGREKIFKELFRESNSKAKERKENEKKEEEAGITDKEKKEAKEVSPERSSMIVFVNEQMALDTPESIGEAYKSLHLYRIANPEESENDITFLHLEEIVSKRKREILIKKSDKSEDKKMEEAVDRIADKKEFQEEIEAHAIEEINIEETQKSQERHKKVSAHERAREESIDKASGNQEKKELVEEYYELDDEEHILASEGKETGEEMTEVKLDEKHHMNKEEAQQQKEAIRKHQGRITKKEGFTHVKLVDEKGKEVEGKEAAKKHEERGEKLDQKMAEEAANVINLNRKAKSPKESFASTADKVALERAKKRRDEEKKEIPKRAA